MSEALNHKGIWTDEASKALSEASNRSTQVAKEYLTLYGVPNNIANINTLLVPREEIESLRAENGALKREAHENKQRARAFERDAERYRWLRSRLPGAAYRVAGIIYSEGRERVDAGIDAAIAAEKEQQ